MKKIPTLYERIYDNHKIVGITDKVTPGCEDALTGKWLATIKYDGACCAIINGELYKRYDAKKGKNPPAGAIPCCDPDPITGHWPHWVKCDINKPEDKWFFAAYNEDPYDRLNGTYEAIGPHFQGNPYSLDTDRLIRHGDVAIPQLSKILTQHELKAFLEEHYIEGIVWWKDGEPKCKLKRSDFGLKWPCKEVFEKYYGTIKSDTGHGD